MNGIKNKEIYGYKNQLARKINIGVYWHIARGEEVSCRTCVRSKTCMIDNLCKQENKWKHWKGKNDGDNC